MIRTLHVDIEGGWGGSSRSLYHLISRLDRERISPIVAHRQKGPVERWYADLGIPTVHVPEIASYVPRRRNSTKIFLASLPRLLKLRSATKVLTDLIRRNGTDLVHLNYEGLFLLARGLKKETGLPIVCHNRAHLPENLWARWLVGSLMKSADHFFFISPQEEHRVRELENASRVDGDVIWNIAPPRPNTIAPASDIPEAVYLGSVDPAKGTDRLLDVAAALNHIGARPLTIVVYGEARQAGQGYVDSMQERISREALHDRIRFAGFTSNPEEVLASAFALIRPSREADPWGRDVIEATAFGIPVLATGTYEGVVEDGRTGFLFDPFDARAIAEKLQELLEKPDMRDRISAAAIEKGDRTFGGADQAEIVTKTFERLVANV